MNKLSEKQLLILTVAVTVLLAGGLGYLVWRDLEEVKQEEQKAADLRTQIRLAQVEIDQIPAREYRVIANREISDREVAFLPEETEIETFWEVLERFAVESGVQISKITQTNTRSGAVKRGAASSAIESVEQVLKLRGSADEFLRFMNLVENYDRIINVGEFSISSGKADEDGKIRHSIQMTLKTFTYSKKIANTIVSIPHYEKKKEHAEVKKWLSAIKLEEKETYTLRTSLGRRDPFADVRRKPADGVQPGGPDDRTAQEAILQTLIEQVRSLREGLDIEDHLRKINDLWRLAQQAKENREAFRQLATLIDNTRRENLVTIRDLQDRFQNDVIAPYQEIRDRLGKMEEDRPLLARSQVEQYHKRVVDAFEERNWRKLAEEIRAWNDASKNGQHVLEEARDLAEEIGEFKHRGDVIQEFEKKVIKITALVYSPNGISVAVINGATKQEGDALEADGRVIIAEIGENYVIFNTEGVDIKRHQSTQ